MHHLTLLTGHTRESPRSEVADHVIEGTLERQAIAATTHTQRTRKTHMEKHKPV